MRFCPSPFLRTNTHICTINAHACAAAVASYKMKTATTATTKTTKKKKQEKNIS